MCRFLLTIFLAILGLFSATTKEPGPKYIPTKGEVWPKPQKQIKKSTYYVIKNENVFNVTKPHYTCDIVDKAVKRLLYRNLVNKFRFVKNKTNEINTTIQNNVFHIGFVTNETQFRIELTKKCEQIPHLDMDEKYELAVEDTIVLSSVSAWGILRGLETFNHLLYFSNDYTEVRINATIIEDFPAYKHRGLLIDTGRHYLTPGIISRLIDSMEMNKLNVLHWHIVDDESFPYQSKAIPELSKSGAFHPSMVYTKKDIKRIIEQARLAGIRVIPELDVPGHTRSWGKAFPSMLTKCYLNNTEVGLGPLNPFNKKTYHMIRVLYTEVSELFPDEYIHIGGDEVDWRCWDSNHMLQRFKKEHFLKNTDLSLFIHKVLSLMPPQMEPIFWQDVIDNFVKLPEKTIIQVWKNKWVQEMDKLLAAKYRVLFSASWYLNNLKQNWDHYYKADPRQMVYLMHMGPNQTGIDTQKLDDIVGGEACLWGELVDETNVFTSVWPNTAAVAERLWSGLNYELNFTLAVPSSVTDDVRRRMEEHSCRMRQAGVPVAPAFGSGYCVHEHSMIQGYN